MNDEQMNNYIKEYNEDVKGIKKQIAAAKAMLASGQLHNPEIKSAFERLVMVQECQLNIVMGNHKLILELNWVGE